MVNKEALAEQPAQQEPVALKPCWYESKQEKMCRKCGQVHAEAIPPAQYFDEVMYDGSSTAEALKRFQENVRPTSLPDAFEQLMRESDKPTKVPEQIAKYAAALVSGTHEITNLTIRPKRTWVGLTQDEFRDFASTLDYGTGGLIRAIEAKLKEKNT